ARLPHDHGGNGPGSSPILYKNLFILNCDGTELRYVVALDKKTGKQVWKTDRSNDMSAANPQKRKAYATPTIINVNGQDQLVSPGAFRLSSYDPLTGKEIWWVDVPGYSNVQPPVYANGLLYVSSCFDKAQLWVIKPDGKGDLTQTHVAWKYLKGVPSKPSPIVIGKDLFLVSDDGIVTCLDAIDGTEIWKERIGGAYSATPLHVDGRLYLFSHTGDITVLQPGRELKILAKSKLGDGFMSAPAVVDDALILRSKTHLYRIQK
ncbi:MAG: outer rane biosis protein BamB, partial [Verrucomicrobia bacterium]|nr:outer rane biosis protein BamB [Verrucomicrobiota bacterium]